MSNMLIISGSLRKTLDNDLLWIIMFIITRDKHYYDEDNVEVGKNFDCRVVVNHTVELTAEEKQQARKDAIQRVQDDAYTRMKQPLRKPQTKQTEVNNQLNLFAV